MQKVVHAGRLLRLFAAKNFLPIIVTLLAFAATRADSAEPILKLAMIRQDPSPKQPSIAAHDHFTTGLSSPSTNFVQKVRQEKKSESKADGATNFSPIMRLEKNADLNPNGEIRLVHKKLGANECSERWMDIQAGYGQVCYNPEDLKKIDPNRQEPGCIYLKASFSF